MRSLLSLSALALALGALVASPPLARSEDWKREQKDTRIPMRDGASLAADLYFPSKPGKYPAILIQTPYGKARLGAPISSQEPGGEKRRGSESDLGLLDRESYVYAIVDWRGFYASKDAMAGVKRGAWSRGDDGYDLVEWLAARDWSTGKVGTWGGSALGKVQLDTAAQQPPHLVCAVPLIASMGTRHDDYYEGGVFLEAHTQRLASLGFPMPALIKDTPSPEAPAWRIAERRSYHPEKIEVPCLFVTGWWDNYPAQVIQNFEDVVAKGGERARKHSKLLVGPWDHVSVGLPAQGARTFEKAAHASGEAARAFFDVWLRGEPGEKWEKTPRVRFWTVNEDAWTGVESWSALERETSVLHLAADGRLVAEKPGAGTPDKSLERVYTCDPKKPSPTLGGRNLPPVPHGPGDLGALDKRADVLVYSTGRLASPLGVDGAPTVSLTFAADRPDCDFIAQLADVDESGRATLLVDGAQRAKWRTPGKGPQLLEKGTAVKLTVTLSPLSATLPKGHELRLYVTSASSPRYERNTHTGADHWEEASAVPVTVTVFHDAERPSALSLPVRKGRR